MYTDIFIEHIQVAFLLPIGSEITLTAMQSFAGYDMSPALLLAGVGSLIGLLANWLIGMAMRHNRRLFSKGLSEEKYQQIAKEVQKIGWLFIPFWFYPAGIALPLLAAFFGVRWWVGVPMLVVGAVFKFGF